MILLIYIKFFQKIRLILKEIGRFLLFKKNRQKSVFFYRKTQLKNDY